MPYYAEYKKKGTRNHFIAVKFASRERAERRARDYALIYGRGYVEHVVGNIDKGTARAETIARFKRVRK